MSVSKYEIIVVGAGHAGCEAALASARMGLSTVLITLKKDKIAEMSCNPSLGGLAKGQLIKEIDALGGEMGLAADDTSIQFRTLNTKKGPAVRATRVQSDKEKYRQRMTSAVENTNNLEVLESEVESILIENEQAKGIILKGGEKILSKSVILTPGTFLDGVVLIGHEKISSGRDSGGEYEPASNLLAKAIKELKFKSGRLKTGTVPRLLKDSINFEKLEEQKGDDTPRFFSFFSNGMKLDQVSCFITYTNKKTHDIVNENLGKSALYGGFVRGTGARYCPSLEDKLVKFKDRDRHQIFLEPEGLNSKWIYPNGISNSLPLDVQKKMVNSIEGLEDAVIERPGYAIEYDFVNPMELYPWLETKKIKNLFFAGQINGTSGYEEAAAQGLIAGINAAHKSLDKDPYIIDRSKGYIGVLIDDLVTKGTMEPYRMFTSRAEYRLVLREDNADRRLCEDGHELGLLSDEKYDLYKTKLKSINDLKKRITKHELLPNENVNEIFKKLNLSPMKNKFNLSDFLKRPQTSIDDTKNFVDWIDEYSREVREQVEIDVKYEGYIRRQNEEIEKYKHYEHLKIPHSFDYASLSGLTTEVKQKLSEVRPQSLGQAYRISGITPAAISVLTVYLKKHGN